MRHFILLLAIMVGLSTGFVPGAQASADKEFIMSCTYGVLAGTLVGAASLAFSDKPGENLQHVARGASLGLYVGIGLGLYSAYILPGQLEREEEKIIEETSEQATWFPRWLVFPVLADNHQVDGAGAFVQIKTF